MKSVRLRKEVKDRLDGFGDGLSTNKALRLLLEDADTNVGVLKREQEYYVIKIDDDLLVRLNECKGYPTESLSDVVSRLLAQKDC